MTNLLHYLIPLGGGFMIGFVFFAGLWFSVRKITQAHSSVAAYFLSYLTRAAFAIGGFYILSGGDYRKSLVCLLGFIAARVLVKRVITRQKLSSEVDHAP